VTAGVGKSIAAMAAGFICTIIVGGLSMAGITLPDSMSNAVQGLLTLVLVYYTPHSIGGNS
jgi:hypothetical protein